MTSRIVLPKAPSTAWEQGVAVWSEPLTIDSYMPEDPDRFPAYLDRRVYQGSSGRVYPLPFHERISPTKQPHTWKAVHLENEWMRLVVLPELGGRLHIAYDKVAGYDIFYRNNVIKPALVGLAGPWISGGIEFNWPQHHRPATFLPTDVEIERDDDGTVTVWCSDHDPFTRMKGMHGIRLSPTSSRVDVRVRLYNRSEVTQTFLWWANVAAAANDHYQSFFPADVTHVADHAKRAVVSFPRPDGPYYGIDYAARATEATPDGDRLDWYRNIPVPTSYMALDTAEDFFGGYDHRARAGFVHVAPHEISPGKKQWTWGNAPFGWAWDRNLTDDDGPYVELMAGVYSDNQPDFAFLGAGETKTFTQTWYPIREIGPVQFANRELALSVRLTGESVVVGVCAAEVLPDITVTVGGPGNSELARRTLDLGPAKTLTLTCEDVSYPRNLTVVVAQQGRVLARVHTGGRPEGDVVPTTTTAVAPPNPCDAETVDDLVHIATYLDQYRQATRSAVPYLEEALRRDPRESRALLALGAKAYDRAEYDLAADLLSRSAARATAWTSTPVSGEAHYRLGLTLARLRRSNEAASAFSRAFWDQRFAVPARFALARLRCRQGDLAGAVRLLEEVLEIDARHLQSADLLATVRAEQGDRATATALAHVTVRQDPLDAWARDLCGTTSPDATTMLDVALEYAAAGFTSRALTALDAAEISLPAQPKGQVNIAPLIDIHRAALAARTGDEQAARSALEAAERSDTDCAHPSRLEDVDALQIAVDLAPDLALPPALLGHWLYAKDRHDDAIEAWNKALDASPNPALATVLHRNLGLAAYNVSGDTELAQEHYRAAVALDPDSAKLHFEQDQLDARAGVSAPDRLHRLEGRRDLVATRDDLTVAFAHLLLDVGRLEEARELLATRWFQPWEGGEGQVLGAWDRTALLLGRHKIDTGAAEAAVAVLTSALTPPASLGEGRHASANVAELHLALGDALATPGDRGRALVHWEHAADSVGDFVAMSQTPYSGNTIYAASALERMGRHLDAESLVDGLVTWVNERAAAEVEVDFFATSLPSMLLFVEEPSAVRDREVTAIRRQIREWRCETTSVRGLVESRLV